MNSLSTSYRAVFFDFDGTLADSYRAIAASVNHVRAQYQQAPLPVAEVRRFVGRGPEHLLRHTLPGIDVEHGYGLYRAHHPSVLRSGTELLPGAVETLRTVKHSQRLTAICSNKPRLFTQELLEFFGLAELVDLVVGPEDVAKVKPAPDMLLLALQRLQVAATETLYVGDMTVDVETARAAGVAVWVVPTGSDEPQALARAQPDRLLADLHEVLSLLSAAPARPQAFS